MNRLSFGVQSFDDGCLQRLGRIHSSGDAERAVKAAQDAGFDNFNLDLMYALPEQTLAMAEHDIERAVALQPTHISHYQLTLEPNTVFAAPRARGHSRRRQRMGHAGRLPGTIGRSRFRQYEVSAYAREGRQCAHNLNYWKFGDYLGIGAGAHGKTHLGAQQQVLRRWKVKASDRVPAEGRHRLGDRRRRGSLDGTLAVRLHAERVAPQQRRADGDVRGTHCPAPPSPSRRRSPSPVNAGWLTPTDWLRPTSSAVFANDAIGLLD